MSIIHALWNSHDEAKTTRHPYTVIDRGCPIVFRFVSPYKIPLHLEFILDYLA